MFMFRSWLKCEIDAADWLKAKKLASQNMAMKSRIFIFSEFLELTAKTVVKISGVQLYL